MEAEPAAAASLFGDRIDVARDFARELGSRGEELGLIGPLEADRLWSRHILNCVLPAPLLRPGLGGEHRHWTAVALSTAAPQFGVVACFIGTSWSALPAIHHDGRANYAWQFDEYDSPRAASPELLLNRESPRGTADVAQCGTEQIAVGPG